LRLLTALAGRAPAPAIFRAARRHGHRTGGTSCFSCHHAHGSTRNQYLIRFNENVVEPNADDRLEFEARDVASRHGSCFLRCHGVEHDSLAY